MQRHPTPGAVPKHRHKSYKQRQIDPAGDLPCQRRGDGKGKRQLYRRPPFGEAETMARNGRDKPVQRQKDDQRRLKYGYAEQNEGGSENNNSADGLGCQRYGQGHSLMRRQPYQITLRHLQGGHRRFGNTKAGVRLRKIPCARPGPEE